MKIDLNQLMFIDPILRELAISVSLCVRMSDATAVLGFTCEATN